MESRDITVEDRVEWGISGYLGVASRHETLIQLNSASLIRAELIFGPYRQKNSPAKGIQTRVTAKLISIW